MMVFCTLFNSSYFSRFLAMYRSLKRHCPGYRLYVFPFDNESMDLLQKMKLTDIIAIPLSDFEDENLLKVKPFRTKVEYCWTVPPSMIYYIFQNYHEAHCTYIDADIYFYNDPTALFEEWGNRSVLLTEHRFTPQYDTSAIFGKYCVQYISFKNDANGLKALLWWRDVCIEWCYDRIEDGKFADQKYLDEFSGRFEGIHVLQHKGGGIAPWNVQQYNFNTDGKSLEAIEKTTGNRFPVIFYHYHYVRFYPDATIDIGDYQLTRQTIDIIYKPYLAQLQDIKNELKQYNIGFDPHGPRTIDNSWNARIIRIKRRIKGRYNRYPVKKLIP